MRMSAIYRKRQILQYIKNHPGDTARKVSEALDISIANAEMFLFRLFRAVLVSRDRELTGKSQKPSFTYQVSVRGSERLAYWKAQEEKRVTSEEATLLPRKEGYESKRSEEGLKPRRKRKGKE